MILVTGAAGILGQAVIHRLSQDGEKVAAVDFQEKITLSGQSLSLGGIDLTDDKDCERMLLALKNAGVHTLDGLVNVAGGFTWEKIADGSWQSWERMLRINLQSAHHAIVNALPLLRERHGAIVNIGAAAADYATTGMGAYAASKSAVARLTEAIASEELQYGIRANAILPSIIDTPQNRIDMPDADFSKWALPSEIAAVAAFLLSRSASGVTGASIPVIGRLL